MKQFPVDDSVRVASEGASLESECAGFWDESSEEVRKGFLKLVVASGAHAAIAAEWPGGKFPPARRAEFLHDRNWARLSPFWQCCVHMFYDQFMEEEGAQDS